MSTDNLMRLQVEQLAKEKKELAERMRIASKRLDHIERAYRKEERPLLSKDYDLQQESDKAAFEAAQKSRLEAHRLGYQRDMETKKRLARAMPDYLVKKEEIMGKRKEEFQRRQELAQNKIEEEKAKRKAVVLKRREEERLRREDEERIEREKEEEERQQEAGKPGSSSSFTLSSLTESYQSALRRRNGVPPKRRQSVLGSKPRSAKKRRPGPKQSGSVKKTGLPAMRRFAYSNSARRRPLRERRLVQLSVAKLLQRRRPFLCVLLPALAPTLGDAPALFPRLAQPALPGQRVLPQLQSPSIVLAR